MLMKIFDMKIITWFKESNRYKHLLGGAITALISIFAIYIIPVGIISAIIAAGCLEIKDKLQGNKFDWIDFIFTVVGGIVIQGIYEIIMYYVNS